MRLAEFWNRVKGDIARSPDLPKSVFVLICLCFIGFGSFLLLRMLSMETSRKGSLQIVQNSSMTDLSGGGKHQAGGMATVAMEGMYVASKTGEVYYLPWCGGVKLIHEENKVWFESKEEAAAQGYRPATNCKGI